MDEELSVSIVVRKPIATTLEGKTVLEDLKAHYASDPSITVTGTVNVRFVPPPE